MYSCVQMRLDILNIVRVIQTKDEPYGSPTTLLKFSTFQYPSVRNSEKKYVDLQGSLLEKKPCPPCSKPAIPQLNIACLYLNSDMFLMLKLTTKLGILILFTKQLNGYLNLPYFAVYMENTHFFREIYIFHFSKIKHLSGFRTTLILLKDVSYFDF